MYEVDFRIGIQSTVGGLKGRFSVHTYLKENPL